MMFNEATQRWNWINAFLTASLHAAIVNLDQQPTSKFTFKDFIKEYITRLRNTLSELAPSKTPPNWGEKNEIEYVFHLESEVWGIDYERYLYFFDDISTQRPQPLLQTFKFITSFYAIERCLSSFQIPQRRANGTGRKGRRRDLFGYENGIFSSQFPHICDLMGPPFYLRANTVNLEVSNEKIQAWQALKLANIPSSLQSFYKATSGYAHFTDILEASFVSTRKTHLPANLRQKNQKRLPTQTRAWWYDVLWKYSESLRYNRVLPSRTAQEYPFFWNRSVRWFTSLTLTGLFCIAAHKNPNIGKAWRSITIQNSILRDLYKDIDRL
ncbi:MULTISPECIES: hypothetical protein [Caldilinea]|nr:MULTISPECIES: hypothetical protein [Caldilinea]